MRELKVGDWVVCTCIHCGGYESAFRGQIISIDQTKAVCDGHDGEGEFKMDLEDLIDDNDELPL